MLLQRFNAVLLHVCLPALDCADWVSYRFVSFFFQFFLLKSLENISTEGIKNNNNKNNTINSRKVQTSAKADETLTLM